MLGCKQCNCVRTIKPEIILNYILKFKSYFTKNRLRLDFTDQPVTAAQGRKLSVESYTNTNVGLLHGQSALEVHSGTTAGRIHPDTETCLLLRYPRAAFFAAPCTFTICCVMSTEHFILPYKYQQSLNELFNNALPTSDIVFVFQISDGEGFAFPNVNCLWDGPATATT